MDIEMEHCVNRNDESIRQMLIGQELALSQAIKRNQRTQESFDAGRSIPSPRKDYDNAMHFSESIREHAFPRVFNSRTNFFEQEQNFSPKRRQKFDKNLDNDFVVKQQEAILAQIEQRKQEEISSSKHQPVIITRRSEDQSYTSSISSQSSSGSFNNYYPMRISLENFSSGGSCLDLSDPTTNESFGYDPNELLTKITNLTQCNLRESKNTTQYLLPEKQNNLYQSSNLPHDDKAKHIARNITKYNESDKVEVKKLLPFSQPLGNPKDKYSLFSDKEIKDFRLKKKTSSINESQRHAEYANNVIWDENRTLKEISVGSAVSVKCTGCFSYLCIPASCCLLLCPTCNIITQATPENSKIVPNTGLDSSLLISDC